MASYVVENRNEPQENVNEFKSSKKSLFKGFNFKKIGGLKPLFMILIFLVVAVVLYNYSGFGTTSSGANKQNTIGYTTSLEYIKEIEGKLNEVIGEIKGVGNVKVMLSVSSSPEISIAENVEEKTVTTSSGTTNIITTEPILVELDGKDNPLILKETLPTINGVIVVSSGAGNVKVKLDILTAVSTALGISPNKIEVFIGK